MEVNIVEKGSIKIVGMAIRTFGFLFRWVNESDYELADIYSIEVHDNTLESVVLMFPIQLKI